MGTMESGLKIKQFVPNDPTTASNKSRCKRIRPHVPEEQRKRARQACGNCRQRKTRCLGDTPCERCIKEDTVCTLASERNVLPEDANSVSLSKAERAVYLEKALKNILGVSKLTDKELKVMAETVPTTLRSNGELRQEEFADQSSLSGFSRRLEQQLGHKEPDDDESYRLKDSYTSKPPDSELKQDLVEALDGLPERYITESLVDICFRYVQCNSFYVSPKWVCNTLHKVYSNPKIVHEEDIPSIATLMMVVALGTQFVGMTSLALPVPIGQSMDFFENLGSDLHHKATSMLPGIIKQSTFESVRACLLIATYFFPIDLPGLAYTYLGLALHISMRIGMHKRLYYTTKALPPIREEQIRVWWTLYTFYQRARIFHGHPRTLTHSDVYVDRPRPIAELEPSNGVSNFRNQVALIDVTIILEDIAQEIAMLRRARKGVHIANLLVLRRKLAGLLDQLPALNYHDQAEVNLHRLRLDIHVHLHYWHTRLFLGRPFLLSNGKSSETNPSMDRTDSTTTVTSGTHILVQDSVNAALRIIELCQMIHGRIGLAKASYATEFTSCRASMLVLIAKSITEDRDGLKTPLSDGLELIKQMSSNHGQASSEARVIVALQRAITRLHQEVGRGDDRADAYQMEQEMHQDPFQQWERLWQYPEIPLSEIVVQGSTIVDQGSFLLRVLPSQQDENAGIGGTPSFDGYDAISDDIWSTFVHSQLDDFSLIPEMEYRSNAEA